MKITEFPYMSNMLMNCLATAIANAKIPGLKAKRKLVIDAFAQQEGLTPEALSARLNEANATAFDVVKQDVEFCREAYGEPAYLQQVYFVLAVHSEGKEAARIVVELFLGREAIQAGAYRHPTLPNIQINTPPRGSDSTALRQRIQRATVYAMEICEWIDGLGSAPTPTDFVQQGWKVSMSNFEGANSLICADATHQSTLVDDANASPTNLGPAVADANPFGYMHAVLVACYDMLDETKTPVKYFNVLLYEGGEDIETVALFAASHNSDLSGVLHGFYVKKVSRLDLKAERDILKREGINPDSYTPEFTPALRYYQPNDEHFPESMASFEAYLSLDTAKEQHPDVPADAWITLRNDDIEDPTFLDADNPLMEGDEGHEHQAALNESKDRQLYRCGQCDHQGVIHVTRSRANHPSLPGKTTIIPITGNLAVRRLNLFDHQITCPSCEYKSQLS